MTNLYYGKINSEGGYVDLAEAAEVSFTAGTTYKIQSQGVITIYEDANGNIQSKEDIIKEARKIINNPLKSDAEIIEEYL